MKTVFEHSAGAVLETPSGGVVLIKTRNMKGDPVCALPKGHVEQGESTVEAALREAREETGFNVEDEVVQLTAAQYWYVRDGVRVRKRVDWFHVRTTQEEGADFDEAEIDDVLVVDVEEALELLTYDSERATLTEALCE